jgi:hypothetical protein
LEKTRRFIWMWRQNAPNSKSALNHLFSLQLHPCQFRSPPLHLRASFNLVPGFEFSQLSPQLALKLQYLCN